MTYIITYTGKKFSLVDPQPEDICIEDIAHHLSLLCRYNGACTHFYSVAQHCVLMKERVPEHPAQALLHDAGEAYTGDFSSPLKAVIEQLTRNHFREFLAKIDRAIFDKFNISLPCAPEIKKADTQLFVDEWFHLMHGDSKRSFNGGGQITKKIDLWSSATAEQSFLKESYQCLKQDK